MREIQLREKPPFFISALYNEEDEVTDLLRHVAPIVTGYRIVDDASTDGTTDKLRAFQDWATNEGSDFLWKSIPHSGLPETVKNEARNMVPDGSWCLMLDADERFDPHTLVEIMKFLGSEESTLFDYIYFNQYEVIDGVHVRTFQKAKLFRKEAITFPLHNIHADDQFEGRGTYKEGWVVFHRKSTYKQINRETEYLATYKKLLEDGHIDEGRYRWLVGLHHYVKPRS
jgi:glycosyltransferase involved in cell wall biosynthesis